MSEQQPPPITPIAYAQGPQPVDYATPPPKVSLGETFNAWVCAWTMLLLAFVTIVAYFVMPKFEQIFRDFNTRLPPLTQISLDVSRTYTKSYLWIPALTVPVALGFLAAGKRGRWVSRLIWIIFVTLLLIAIVSIFAPMISLIQTVSSPKGSK